MDQLNILSGSEIVAKGHQKVNVTLPELGLKELIPNGSWIEQKQVQAALDARKDIVEIERIEKYGILSQAEWKEDLSLAEVTLKCGGYWQFFGHNIDKTVYLYPEEALFLMEVNCLQLKYHGIPVSVQQAYALMFKSDVSILRYKVFASLSRLGYKVFRHAEPPRKIAEKRKNVESTENSTVDISSKSEIDSKKRKCSTENSDTISNNDNFNITIMCDVTRENNCAATESQNNCDDQVENNQNNVAIDSQGTCCKDKDVINDSHTSTFNEVMSISDSSEIDILKTNGTVSSLTQNSKQNMLVHNYRLKKLRNRKQMPSCLTSKVFESIPELFQKQTVTIKAPNEDCIPKNIYLNLTDYVINLDYMTSINHKKHSGSSSRTYTMSDEANGPHVKRLKNTSHAETGSIVTPPPLPSTNIRFRAQTQYRPFQFWRPRPQFSFFQYQFLFQRPFGPRYQYNPTPPLIFMRCPNQQHINPNTRPNVSHNRKRTRDSSKHYHMDAIKRLVLRLKQLVQSGIRHEQNIHGLQSLVNTYNVRYKSRLRISSEFDIVDDSVVDTIELDDDEASPPKRSHLEPNFENFSENLNKLKQIALRVKEYESKNSVNNSRHRRSLINAIRTFNKSYNAEVILNTNFEVLDRRHITLASSSDSDCVIEEVPAPKSGKKLRNPFNILKQLSEKRNSIILSQSDTKTINSNSNVAINLDTEDYAPEIRQTFANWLPPSSDFGRPEVPHVDYKDDIIDNIQGEHLIDYIASHRDQYEKWVDLKISFIENINLNSTMIQSQRSTQISSGMSPIIKPEDCTDMQRVLRKLSIVKNNRSIGENSLKIDYDVYNRDVQNFRLTNRPPPHFMVVCLDESSNLPPAADIAALTARYSENDTITFAIVGIGSVQYIHINPTELPMYIPNSELS